MFAELKEYDVKYSLKKADGDLQTALDDLLNVQYLQATGQQVEGVDGFFIADSHTKPDKKKRKGKKLALSDADPSADGAPTSPRASLETCEDSVQDEAEYIAERFGIRPDEVLPVYKKNHGSKGATVTELLGQYMSVGVETQDEHGKESAEALAKKYRHVPEEYMRTIVHVAGSIPQFADDIAALLNRHFGKQIKAHKMDLAYRLTPLPQHDIEGGEASPTIPPQTAGWAAKPACSTVTDYEEAVSRANAFDQASRHAASSAAQLQRRGACTHLYRQAASYYTDRAREQARYAQSARSTAADILVDGQSTNTCIDLHGVPVHDGVRIARQRVRDWWRGLGEVRAQRLRERGGFTIITGLGRHNAGGVSHLRQAVAAALLQDGWKLTVETGKFVVTGRQ
ncbi:hypothetical protein UVI_02013790 [Ustilaginoidea virens]|uniref:Smr domain-containing protein n=1 Tax=Ustilaginoidea virens TaxID=1159556 RepID=A0A1B5KSB1_USTVR|nr:hypothetical protein UVI_02013790 [Ustilaginoidea virens]